MPFLRTLHQPLSLTRLRRARVGVGALVPWWAAEAAAGAMILWTALSCNEAVQLALRDRARML
eukprot:7337071-Prymnesium_polylepis.1